MAPERQPDIRLTGIHIDLVDRLVTLDAEDGRNAKLSFGKHPILPTGMPDGQSDTPDELTADDSQAWEEPIPAPCAAPAPPHSASRAPPPAHATVVRGSAPLRSGRVNADYTFAYRHFVARLGDRRH